MYCTKCGKNIQGWVMGYLRKQYEAAGKAFVCAACRAKAAK